MAVRTSSAAVGGIIEVDATIDLTPFIETASALVDDIAAGDTNSVLTDTRLELIERWLSAYFYAIRDPRTSRERADRIELTYQTKVDLNLSVTHYGQQAMILDSTGQLKLLSDGKRRTVTLTWLGDDDDIGRVTDDD